MKEKKLISIPLFVLIILIINLGSGENKKRQDSISTFNKDINLKLDSLAAQQKIIRISISETTNELKRINNSQIDLL